VERWRLDAVQLLLAQGAPPPWPPIIVRLAGGAERACAALARPLVDRERFALGREVRAWDAQNDRWFPGRVVGEDKLRDLR
jgi:hypothetical protein